jgi:transposase
VKQQSLPFEELLPTCLVSPLFSCNCEGQGVECQYKLKAKAPPVAQTTSEADQPNVIAHVEAESTPIVQQSLGRKQGCTMDTSQKRRTYPQVWPAYNRAQTSEKSRFLELLYHLCFEIEDLPRKAGAGRSRLPLKDMLFCSVFKIYSTVSGRRFISDLREAQQRGFISKTPHFNSIFNYLELEEMTDVLKALIVKSSLPLRGVEWDFAVDSSGFSTGQFTRWIWAKYGMNPHVRDREEWIKVHLICGVMTNIVTSVEITGRNAADSPQFAPLVEQTAKNFVMNEVSADKAYSSEKNIALTLVKGAQPYIAFRANATGGNNRSTSVWKRMFHFYQYNQQSFLEHYHKRSNVETTFSMIKGKFGERLRSKTLTAQVNEVLCKVLCHNICCVIQSIYELGIDADFSEQIALPPTHPTLEGGNQ